MALVQEVRYEESSGLIDESKHLTECVKAKTHLTFEWRGKADEASSDSFPADKIKKRYTKLQ